MTQQLNSHLGKQLLEPHKLCSMHFCLRVVLSRVESGPHIENILVALMRYEGEVRNGSMRRFDGFRSWVDMDLGVRVG